MKNTRKDLNIATIHYFGETTDWNVQEKKQVFLELARVIIEKGTMSDEYGRIRYEYNGFKLKEDCFGEWVLCDNNKTLDYIRGFLAMANK